MLWALLARGVYVKSSVGMYKSLCEPMMRLKSTEREGKVTRIVCKSYYGRGLIYASFCGLLCRILYEIEERKKNLAQRVLSRDFKYFSRLIRRKQYNDALEFAQDLRVRLDEQIIKHESTLKSIESLRKALYLGWYNAGINHVKSIEYVFRCYTLPGDQYKMITMPWNEIYEYELALDISYRAYLLGVPTQSIPALEFYIRKLERIQNVSPELLKIKARTYALMSDILQLRATDTKSLFYSEQAYKIYRTLVDDENDYMLMIMEAKYAGMLLKTGHLKHACNIFRSLAHRAYNKEYADIAMVSLYYISLALVFEGQNADALEIAALAISICETFFPDKIHILQDLYNKIQAAKAVSPPSFSLNLGEQFTFVDSDS